MAKYPDFYYPIPEASNRKETMIISFSNIIRNINQAIVYYMLRHPDIYSIDEYPILYKLNRMDDPKGLRLFSITTMIPTRYLLSVLRGGDMVEENGDEKILKNIRMNYDAKQTYHTNMEGGIYRLFSSRFVNKMYIYDPMMKDDKSLQEFCLRLFPQLASYNCEAIMTDESPFEIMIRDKDVTTVMMEEMDEAIFLLENLDKSILIRKAFWVSASCLANTIDATNGKNPKQEKMEALAKEKKVQINYFLSKPLEIK